MKSYISKTLSKHDPSQQPKKKYFICFSVILINFTFNKFKLKTKISSKSFNQILLKVNTQNLSKTNFMKHESKY